MPSSTYKALANITLGTAASAVTFSSIPSNYRDLIIFGTATGSTTLQGRIRLNGDSGTNYAFIRVSGSGSAASAAGVSSNTFVALSSIAQATTTGALQMNIGVMDYSITDKHKAIISRAGQAANGSEVIANVWANTAAVTSIEVSTSTGNWAIGSTFALYGIVS